VGEVTVKLPVAVVQVGCTMFTVGAAGAAIDGTIADTVVEHPFESVTVTV
jgi:hypothetical protein